MTGEPTAAAGLVTCPDCGRQSPADRLLCDCGYPLEFEQRRPRVETAPSVTRAPGDRDDDRDDDTAELPPVVVDDRPSVVPIPTWQSAPAAGMRGELACPSCGEGNPPERTWCARCGHRLRPEASTVAAPAPAPPRRRSAVPTTVAALVALLLTGVLGTLVWQLWERGRPEPRTAATPSDTGTTGPATSAPAEPQELDVSRITVAASSTQTDGCSPDCNPGNLLDGDTVTAWNHDGIGGPEDPEGVAAEGVTVRFSFDEPVDVVALRVVNGYAKTVGERSLFALNHRVAQVEVRGDSGAATVTLEDTPEWRQLEVPIGVTDDVTLTVLSTHPGTTYTDVALSEVRFLVAP